MHFSFSINSKVTSLNSNPTTAFAQLVVQPGTLDYGLYKFVYKVTMLDGIYNNLFVGQVATYVEIIPTGIVVSSLPNSLGGGTLETNLGLSQSITLDPPSYSYDLDKLANISALSFKFYCQVIDNGIQLGYPMLNYLNKIDLYTFAYKNVNLPVSMNVNSTCFSSSGKKPFFIYCILLF
jgi:hypothetical protein